MKKFLLISTLFTMFFLVMVKAQTNQPNMNKVPLNGTYGTWQQSGRNLDTIYLSEFLEFNDAMNVTTKWVRTKAHPESNSGDLIGTYEYCNDQKVISPCNEKYIIRTSESISLIPDSGISLHYRLSPASGIGGIWTMKDSIVTCTYLYCSDSTLIGTSFRFVYKINYNIIDSNFTNEYKFQPEGGVTKAFYLTDDNNRMYYETYGSGKTAIIFVHGWSVNCRSWDDQIDFFKDKNKVILIDLPGFGMSEHNRRDWTMQHYGKDVAGLCKELHLNTVYLVGWSLGTAVAVEAASLLGTNAKAVILVDQLHETEYVYDSTEVEKWFNRQVSKYKDFNAWYKSYHNDSTLAAKYISMMPKEDRIPEWWKPSVVSFFIWQDDYLKKRVSELKIPIRAINASNTSTNEEQWKSFYKDYKLTIFENSTHMLVWEYPQKFNETLLKLIAETSKGPE